MYSCDLKQKRELPVSGTFPWILREISLSVEKRGAGWASGPQRLRKSNLAALMGGYLKPASGEILLDGKTALPQRASARSADLPAPGKGHQPRWKMKKGAGRIRHVPREIMEALGIEEEWLSRYPRSCRAGLQRFCVAVLFEHTISAGRQR